MMPRLAPLSGRDLSEAQGFRFLRKAGQVEIWALDADDGHRIWRAIQDEEIVGAFSPAERGRIQTGHLFGDYSKVQGPNPPIRSIAAFEAEIARGEYPDRQAEGPCPGIEANNA